MQEKALAQQKRKLEERKQRHKMMSKRTRKGQPLMKNVMKNLLDQVRAKVQ